MAEVMFLLQAGDMQSWRRIRSVSVLFCRQKIFIIRSENMRECKFILIGQKLKMNSIKVVMGGISYG